jgi:hypothetical protein
MLMQKRNFNRLSESSFTKKIKVSCQTAKLAKLPNQYMQNIGREYLRKRLKIL